MQLPNILRYSLLSLSIFLVYFFGGKIGLSLAYLNSSVTAVWPPTGIALAALLVFGFRLWPAIFVGAFLVNLAASGDLGSSVLIAIGNTLEGLIGAYLINRFAGGRKVFERTGNVFRFIFFVVFVSTPISATIGVYSLILFELASSSGWQSIWQIWWLGDFSGALLFAPILILLFGKKKIDWTMRTDLVKFLSFLLLIIVSLETLGFLPNDILGIEGLLYLNISVLVWLGYRFSRIEVALGTLLFSILAIFATTRGFGPFQADTVGESLLLLQVFLSVVSTTVLALSCGVWERKQLHEKLEESEKDLEYKVRERTSELERAEGIVENQLRAETQLAKKEKDFISVASHELQTPVALIKGYMSMLVSGQYGKIDSEAKGYILESLSGINRLAKLVKNLLSTSRIDAAKVKLEKRTFDLSELVGGVVRGFENIATEKGLSLDFKQVKNIKVYSDYDKCVEIVTNLIDNAIKYTELGSVLVSVLKEESFAKVIVGDTGIGIKKNVLPHIFDKFYFSESFVSKQSESTGLGLYIVKSLVGLLGGTIKVESRDGFGSKFTFILPIKQNG